MHIFKSTNFNGFTHLGNNVLPEQTWSVYVGMSLKLND